MVVAVAELFVPLESAIRLEAVAVFVRIWLPMHGLTLTVIVNVNDPPFEKQLFVQEIVPLVPTTGTVQLQLPPVPTPVIDWKVVPAGSASRRFALSAMFGPAFATVIV